MDGAAPVLPLPRFPMMTTKHGPSGDFDRWAKQCQMRYRQYRCPGQRLFQRQCGRGSVTCNFDARTAKQAFNLSPAPARRASAMRSDRRAKREQKGTHRFTCVTACSLAVWKLTPPCHHGAASSCYRGVRTTPRTGLQPARLIAVTANG